jgi:hypothetical protein
MARTTSTKLRTLSLAGTSSGTPRGIVTSS